MLYIACNFVCSLFVLPTFKVESGCCSVLVLAFQFELATSLCFTTFLCHSIDTALDSKFLQHCSLRGEEETFVQQSTPKLPTTLYILLLITATGEALTFHNGRIRICTNVYDVWIRFYHH